jgi:hypothetical protein
MKAILLSTLSLMITLPCSAEHITFRVERFLCDSAQHAVQFTGFEDNGNADEVAANEVGKRARSQVCGLYRGYATIESQSVISASGQFYRVTALRFIEDDRLAWVAESGFAPGSAKGITDL